MDLQEAIKKIRSVGKNRVRVIPMDDQPVFNGLHKIEIKTSQGWVPVLEGVVESMAREVVSSATTTKVILG